MVVKTMGVEQEIGTDITSHQRGALGLHQGRKGTRVTIREVGTIG